MAADEVSSRFCRHCGERVKVTRPGTPHVLYAILTIFSCGLFAIVWAAAAILRFGGWRCAHCGQKV